MKTVVNTPSLEAVAGRMCAMQFKKNFLATVFFLCVTHHTYGDDIEDAHRFYEQGDFSKAAIMYEKLARDGHILAAYNLGSIKFAQGNISAAMKWLLIASENNIPEASYSLGLIYAQGMAPDTDYSEAFKWYSKSARLGYPYAQHNLAYLYLEGKGIKVNHEQTVYWLTKSSQSGLAISQYHLGKILRNGNLVPRDSQLALAWLTKAAEQDNPDAQYVLGVMYFKDEGVQHDCDTSKYWMSKAADHGVPKAKIDLWRIRISCMF